MFGHTSTAEAPKTVAPRKSFTRRAPTPAEDLRKLLVLQQAVKDCYREIAQIKKRNKATEEDLAPAARTAPTCDSDPDFCD